MTFAALLSQANAHAARTFGSVVAETEGAWFPTTATGAPTARSGFSVAVSDVIKGAPRIVRDPLTGTITTPAGTIRISFAVASLSYVPLAIETVCIVGDARATGRLYRVSAVEEAGGVYEIELREEAQRLT